MILILVVLVYLLAMITIGYIFLKKIPYPYNVVFLVVCSCFFLLGVFYFFPMLKMHLG